MHACMELSVDVAMGKSSYVCKIKEVCIHGSFHGRGYGRPIECEESRWPGGLCWLQWSTASFSFNMWVRAGCEVVRAHCEVKVPSGSRVPSRDGISHGSLHDLHGCHPTFMEAFIFFPWKLKNVFIEVAGRFHMMKLLSTSVEVVVTC